MQQENGPRDWSFFWTDDWNQIYGSEYKTKWLKLFDSAQRAKSSSPFFHPDIVRAWLESEGGLKRFKPMFLNAVIPGKASVLLPMVCRVSGWKQGYIRRLRPCGDRFFDYHDPLFSSVDENISLDGQFWLRLGIEIKSKMGVACDEFELPRVRSSSHDSESKVWELSDKAPYVRLEKYSSFENYFSSRKSAFRGDVLRQIRRLRAEGELTFDILGPPDGEDAKRWLPFFQNLRSEKYPASPLPPDYMLNLFTHANARSVLHCSLIRLNGRPISLHLGFYCGKTLFWYLPVYDKEFASFSPGKIHLYMAVKWLFENSGEAFDFMRGQESYKSDWTDGELIRMYRTRIESGYFKSIVRRSAATVLNQFGYIKARLRPFG